MGPGCISNRIEAAKIHYVYYYVRAALALITLEIDEQPSFTVYALQSVSNVAPQTPKTPVACKRRKFDCCSMSPRFVMLVYGV